MKKTKLREIIREIISETIGENKKDIGKYPIPVNVFKSYVKEYAREIMAGKKYFSKEDWPIAKLVAQYMLNTETPTNVDEFIEWHNGAKEITGGKPFGMGSGFADASDGMIVDILTDNDNLTDKDIDFIDLKVLPYIQMKAQ